MFCLESSQTCRVRQKEELHIKQTVSVSKQLSVVFDSMWSVQASYSLLFQLWLGLFLGSCLKWSMMGKEQFEDNKWMQSHVTEHHHNSLLCYLVDECAFSKSVHTSDVSSQRTDVFWSFMLSWSGVCWGFWEFRWSWGMQASPAHLRTFTCLVTVCDTGQRTMNTIRIDHFAD